MKGFFWIKFPLNFQTTPVAAVIFLLATKTASGNDVRHGVVGDNGIQPLNIMALFISLVRMYVFRRHKLISLIRLIYRCLLIQQDFFAFLPFGSPRKVARLEDDYMFFCTSFSSYLVSFSEM